MEEKEPFGALTVEDFSIGELVKWKIFDYHEIKTIIAIGIIIDKKDGLLTISRIEDPSNISDVLSLLVSKVQSKT